MAENTVRKEDLVREISNRFDLTLKESNEIVDTFINQIANGVVAGKKVSLPGLFILTAVKREARVAHNPQTGEPIDVPAKFVPRFKASQTLRDAVKKANEDRF